ncbi:MAG: hypothetical protein MUC83_05135 [Pirellula sp.]|jgi:hypothetical protein|nr:hypothetical protein [Pirellula sp.]
MPTSLQFTLPMPRVMSHEEWMTRTKVAFKVRGPRLKDLDAAILFFESAKSERALTKVAEAFLAWIDQNHPNGDFCHSKRNDDKAVESLLPVLDWYFSDPSRQEMIEALNELRELYRRQEMLFYSGKRLEFKLKTRSVPGTLISAVCEMFLSFVTKVGFRLGINENEARSLSQNAEFQRRFQNAFNVLYRTYDGISDVCGSSRTGGTLGQILDVIPGVKLASAGISLIETIRAQRKAEVANILFKSESPEHVFSGLAEFFQREAKNQAIRTVSAGVDIVKLFVPGMQIASLVQNVARISFAIADFLRDYREMEAANAILTGDGPITTEVFSVAPILAAYHICSLDTAGTALFLFNERNRFLSYDFVEKVEKYNKGVLVPIKTKARSLLHSSDLVLVPGGIPLVSLASDPEQLADQHGWFWWKAQNAKRWYKQFRSKPISAYTGNSIAGPAPNSEESKAA